MKKIKLVISAVYFLSFVSCAENEAIEVPEDVASLSDQTKIDTTMDEIQNLYIEEGFFYNFNGISIIVSDKPEFTSRSLCLSNQYIVLGKDLFNETQDNNSQISSLWTHITKQLAQCYFLKNTYSQKISAPLFKKFRLTQKQIQKGRIYCNYYYTQSLPGSLLDPSAQFFYIPNALKAYYLNEIAGRVSGGVYNDIITYQDIDLINKSNQENTNTFRCD